MDGMRVLIGILLMVDEQQDILEGGDFLKDYFGKENTAKTDINILELMTWEKA